MPATVMLTNVTITLIHVHDRQMVYDGSAKYRATSDSIDFEYISEFSDVQSVASAVANGIALLKRELDDLRLFKDKLAVVADRVLVQERVISYRFWTTIKHTGALMARVKLLPSKRPSAATWRYARQPRPR